MLASRQVKLARNPSRAFRLVASALVCLVFFGAFAGSPRVSTAQGVASMAHDLTQSPDFRVRMSAALQIGQTRPPGARQLLEGALTDGHPSVRAAAAAALGNLGDPAAIPALQRRSASETFAGVKAQMLQTIATLQNPPAAAANSLVALPQAKYVVQLGAMTNNTPVRNAQLGSVMLSAAKSQAGSLGGAVVVNASDPAVLSQARQLRLPVMLIDGQLSSLTQNASPNGSVRIEAHVEFTIRKVPQQTLQGTFSGNAHTQQSANALSSQAQVSAVQSLVVSSAVESAMKGGVPGFLAAAGSQPGATRFARTP